MRFFLVFIFLLISVFGSSQKKSKYTIYKMGRPDSFERNNALRNVQGDWKINFVAVGSGVYSSNMDSIINENKKTEATLKLKYGDDWRTFLMKKSEEMLITHNLIRDMIKHQDLVLSSVDKNMFVEVDVKNKRKAIAKVFGIKASEVENRYITYFKYKIKLKKENIILLSDETSLIDFSYPENGIKN